MVFSVYCLIVYQEMKPTVLRAKPSEDVAETEQEMADAVMNAAKKTIITQVIICPPPPSVFQIFCMLNFEQYCFFVLDISRGCFSHRHVSHCHFSCVNN